MKIEFWLDEGEKEGNIGIAKALTETHLSLADLSVTDKECVKAVFERFEGMVKVVRCRECKQRETSDCPMYREEYSEWDDDGYTEVDLIVTDLTEDEGFCHCGAKMDGGNNET